MWLSTRTLVTLLSVSALSTVLLSAGSAWYAHNKGKQYGMDLKQQEWDSEKLIVATNHTRQIIQLNEQLQKAQSRARERELHLRKDADAARVVVVGLQHQLTEANRRIAEATDEAIIEYARTVSDVFAHCTRAYQELAEKADGHANDAVMLHEAWPGQGNRE